jgi:hypothetical protein
MAAEHPPTARAAYSGANAHAPRCYIPLVEVAECTVGTSLVSASTLKVTGQNFTSDCSVVPVGPR